MKRPKSGNKPTLKTIAKELGLGVTTVSRALRNDEKISAETRKIVHETARRLSYHPSRAGLRLRTGKTNAIGLVIDTEEQAGSFVSDLIFGISDVLEKTPYHLFVMPYSRLSDPVAPIRYLVETESVDGILITRIEPNDARVEYLLANDMPFVTRGRTQMGIEHPYHDFDNEAFARLAVRRLAELGRQRIALLAPPANLSFHDHLNHGFHAALEEHGIDEFPLPALTSDSAFEEVRRHVRQVMQRTDRPDGIVNTAGGLSGAGGVLLTLLAAIHDAGLTPGRDVDIVTMQQFASLPFLREQIHVIQEDVREAGRALATSLMGAIDREPTSQLQSLMVPNDVLLAEPVGP
ncbi:MAG: LacI family transcriptional regulator [Pseudomonadota bacterium]